MKTKTTLFLAFALIVFVGFQAQAEDLRKIISLSGTWRFSIGDDVQWASPSYDDSGWDQINVPERWEDQGYNDYNGYAWYRKSFKLGDIQSNTIIYLMLGNIDDADVVYLNGKVVGKSGGFPPYFETAYNKERKYVIPAGYLKEGAENIVAVRVYDSYLEGGIVSGPAGIYFDADNELLTLNLSGRWKFHTGDNKDWKSTDFNDDAWKTIYVPSEWENQGYDNYDGYAWYRFEFKLPKGYPDGEQYLSLGKIDDVDDVYFNGKQIGSVYDLKKDGDYRRKGWEFNARRIYKIPNDLLSRTGTNTIAIKVYDGQLRGGIYEGPVGFMSVDNVRRYRNKYYESQSFWDYIYEVFNEE